MANLEPVKQNSSDEAKPAETAKVVNTDTFDSGGKSLTKALGASGTEIFSGYITEEYLVKLRGRRGAKVFDQMRRTEAQISMLLNAVTNPIKSAAWQVEAADVPNGDKHAEFIEACRTEMIDWPSHIHEALTLIAFGYSIFEVVHQLILDHPKFGQVIGLKGLAFRSQKTIERWIIDNDTSRLKQVEQWVQGDTVADGSKIIKMDAQFLLVMTLNKEGDNYEGIGALRPMYGAYFRKALYQKIIAMGAEQNAKGTVIGTTPANLAKDDPQIAAFKDTLSNFVAHEDQFIMVPDGWKIEIVNNSFDPEKLLKVIQAENTEMANSVCANFLALGMGGGGGSYALGSDLSDFMLGGIKCIANIVSGAWTRDLIPNLIKLNFGPQAAYPKLTVSGIDDKAGKELSEILGTFVDKKIIIPDEKLDTWTRKHYGLPDADPETARKSADPVNPLDPNADPNEDDPSDPEIDPPADPKNKDENKDQDPLELAEHIKLAESFPKVWQSNRDALAEVMQAGLEDIYAGYKDQLRSAWKSATEAQKPSLALKLSPKGLNDYKKELREALAEIATKGITRAKKLTPWFNKKIKLSEHIDSLKLAAPQGGFYDALPAKLKRLVQANANLIAETQNTDVAKLVSFQYGNSLGQDNIDQIIADIDSTVLPALAGETKKGFSVETAAGNATAQTFEQARTEWFFDDDVLDTIESMTYENDEPVSEICQSLVGTTLAIDDPQLDQLATPLHHNCDGEWVPNQKGAKGNPAIKRGGVPLSQKALDSITLCECHGFSSAQ